MFLKPIAKKELLEHLKNIKRTASPGPDDIQPKVIKYIAESKLLPLHHILNLCLDGGIFPEAMRISRITAIHKKGDKKDF